MYTYQPVAAVAAWSSSSSVNARRHIATAQQASIISRFPYLNI